MNRAEQYGMKVVTVDDQFVTSSGEPMEGVPHLGMSGTKIGQQVGEAIAAEMEARGWNPEEVAALRITNNELPTAVERTDGATEALLASGFSEENILTRPSRAPTPAGLFSRVAGAFPARRLRALGDLRP